MKESKHFCSCVKYVRNEWGARARARSGDGVKIVESAKIPPPAPSHALTFTSTTLQIMGALVAQSIMLCHDTKDRQSGEAWDKLKEASVRGVSAFWNED